MTAHAQVVFGVARWRRRRPGSRPIRFETRMKKKMVPTMREVLAPVGADAVLRPGPPSTRRSPRPGCAARCPRRARRRRPRWRSRRRISTPPKSSRTPGEQRRLDHPGDVDPCSSEWKIIPSVFLVSSSRSRASHGFQRSQVGSSGSSAGALCGSTAGRVRQASMTAAGMMSERPIRRPTGSAPKCSAAPIPIASRLKRRAKTPVQPPPPADLAPEQELRRAAQAAEVEGLEQRPDGEAHREGGRGERERGRHGARRKHRFMRSIGSIAHLLVTAARLARLFRRVRMELTAEPHQAEHEGGEARRPIPISR